MSNTNSLKVRFIKPSKQKLNGSVSEYGDCILITGEKNGVIDLGGNSELPSLISYMAQDITPDSLTGKRKLHYLILTHYHSDHITDDISAALLRLSNETESGVDLSECTVYLPHPDINWTAVVHDDMSTLRGRETICLDTLQGVNGLKALGKIHEVKHPNEGEEVNIGTDAKITFYNVDSNHYASYYAYQGSVQNYSDAGTDYNAFSMMTILEHCGHKFVFTGDMVQPAQAFYHEYVRDCDVYKVEHHGLEYNTNDLWLNELNPKYAVICQFSDTIEYDPNGSSLRPAKAYFNRDDEYTYRKTVQHLAAKGTKIFSTYDSESVVIESTIDALKVLEGNTYTHLYGNLGFNVTYPYFRASRNQLQENSDFSIVGGGFTRYGNMIVVQMMVRAKVTKAANHYWTIAGGFPRPFYVGVPIAYPFPEKGLTTNEAHSWHAPMQIIRYGNKTEHYTGWIYPADGDEKGVLNVGVGTTNIPANSTLYISGVYFARKGE